MDSNPELSSNTNIPFESPVSSGIHQLDINSAMESAVRYHQSGHLQEAKNIYKKILGLNPNHPDLLHLLGFIAFQQDNNDEAADLIKKAIQNYPGNPIYHNSLGLALKGQGNSDEAVLCFQKALEIKPAYAEAYNNLAITLQEQGEIDKAVTFYQKALELEPNDINAYYNMGIALNALGKTEEAISCFKKVTSINPLDAEACTKLGNIFKERGRTTEAIIYYKKALHLKPNNPKAYVDLGGAFYQQDELEKAITCCKKALDLDSQYVDAHYNLGITLEALGQIEDAIEEYNQVLRINPRHTDANWNRSLAYLLTENFAEGWTGYEQRIREKDWANVYPYKYKLPRWNGSSFEGKRLFVHDEQGVGDTLQFIRYLPMAKEKGGTIVFETNRALFGLLNDFYGIDMLTERGSNGQPVIECDCFIPLLSLPRIFKTTLNTIPANVPYLHAEPQKVSYWRNRVTGPEFKVGIAWRGNPNHKKDQLRSCALDYFAPLGSIPGIRLYGLQKGETASEEKIFAYELGIINHGEELRDFSDTAGLIENLDLVISVDTAVAHLSGAMGKQVWTLLPFVPDWRWMLYRKDSPWYPTMRLFRQSKRGDWVSVFKNVESALRTLILSVSK